MIRTSLRSAVIPLTNCLALPESIRNAPCATDGHAWAMACGAPICGLSMRERTRKPSLSPAECPEDALIYVRRVSIVAEDRLILIGSRENGQ
jgi:hypothetical protein